MSYRAQQIASAAAALALNNSALRLEEGNGPGTDLYHLLGALLEWADAQNPRVDFDSILEQVRTDAVTCAPVPAQDPAAHLITPGGPVGVFDATGKNWPEVARFATIADAEAFLSQSPRIDPVKLKAGTYGIDAPHGAGHDDDALKIAKDLGFDVFMSMGGAYYSKGLHSADMSNWKGGFQNIVHAAHAANATVEP